MQGYLFQVLIVIEKDGAGYRATCPDLGCVHVYGDTQEEALSNARDAAECYLAMTMQNGDPIPVGIVAWKESRLKLVVETAKRMFRWRRNEHVTGVHMPIPSTA